MKRYASCQLSHAVGFSSSKTIGLWRVTWFIPAFAMAISPGRWPSRIICCGKNRPLIFIGLDEGFNTYMTGSWPERQSADCCHVVVHVMDSWAAKRAQVPALLLFKGGEEPKTCIDTNHSLCCSQEKGGNYTGDFFATGSGEPRYRHV